MKSIISMIVLVLALASQTNVHAQKTPKSITAKFWVAGVCGLCEETIEKVMDTKGVIAADYDLASNQLTVTYKPAKISEEKLHQLLNDAGYDTEKSTCTPEQYGRVHECCKYREMDKH
ncbi:MAG: heavy-metal-associated domain-containing protein [Flavobacteriales bacterium]|nr:heavy-metal-associated domain-containing protein [Flavobacteriales bacterium]